MLAWVEPPCTCQDWINLTVASKAQQGQQVMDHCRSNLAACCLLSSMRHRYISSRHVLFLAPHRCKQDARLDAAEHLPRLSPRAACLCLAHPGAKPPLRLGLRRQAGAFRLLLAGAFASQDPNIRLRRTASQHGSLKLASKLLFC